VLADLNVPCRSIIDLSLLCLEMKIIRSYGSAQVCSILRFPSRPPCCFMDVSSPAGEVSVRVPQQDHYPSVVHRFGADSDWTVGEAGRTGRIMGGLKTFKVLLVLCHVKVRASSSTKCWLPISYSSLVMVRLFYCPNLVRGSPGTRPRRRQVSESVI